MQLAIFRSPQKKLFGNESFPEIKKCGRMSSIETARDS